jgi:uncharacterized protein (TIGR03437 family)
VSGNVFGASADQVRLYVFEFIPDLGWFELSGCGAVPIKSTGDFVVDAAPGIMGRYATRFSAYLVPSTLSIPCVQSAANIPFLLQQNSLSSFTVPRLAQYPTISFGGLTWFVKTAPVPVYAGPQFFVQQNAFVDSLGQLHLRLTKCADSWCAAEIFTTQTLGYGTYTFDINSTVNNLDPNVTLGLFTWDAQAGDQNNREWDIEFGRWGNANASANAQYVVQPYTAPGNITRFLMSPSSSTHTVTWAPNSIQFRSTGGNGLINQWVYPGNPSLIPTPGDAHLHLNLYVAVGSAPSVPVNSEIVISNFQYNPSGAQIGFARNNDGISFLAGSYPAPATLGGSGCSATVESDSPWLTVTPHSISGGGTVQYSVGDNIGTARTGNLIMQSTNCNVALSSQILTVTQAGFTCSPTFAVGSTHIGFIESVRSVLIRGTASACSWTVTSTAPWLRLVSSRSGSGDGSIQFSADTNLDSNSRVGVLSLDNGQLHFVNQDGSGSFLALSPLAASPCGNQPVNFAASWVAQTSVEIRLASPNGQSIGQFPARGSTLLPGISDGTLIYLLPQGSSQVLASARAAVLPANCTSPAISPLGIVNAASFASISLAPAAFGTIRGSNLSVATAQTSGLPYPTTLGGVSVVISGVACPLSFVSPSQINFVVPSDLPVGRHLLTIGSASSDVIVTSVSPGIFTLSANGAGVPLASLIAVTSDGANVPLSPYQCGSNGCGIAPIALPDNVTGLYIVLYGTGIRNAKSISGVVGQVAAQVPFYGAHPQFPGLDQVNLLVTNTAGLTGHQQVSLQVDGVVSNLVDLLFK